MASARTLLAWKHNWLLTPENFVAPLMAAGTVYYAQLTMQLPGPALLALRVLVIMTLPVLMAFCFRRYRIWLRPLRELSTGALEPTPENVERAARKVHRLADYVFRTSSRTWIAGIALLLLGLKLWVPPVPSVTLVRLAVCGLALFPFGAVISYVLVGRRARVVLPLLVEIGLAPERLVAAVPPPRISGRTRLMALSAVLVLTPSAIIADLTLSILRRGIERAEVAPDAAGQSQAMELALAEATREVLVVGLAVFALAILTAYLAASAYTQPMRSLVRKVRQLEAGELDASDIVAAEDELWSASSAYSAMRAQLAAALGDVRRAGLRVSGTAEQLVQMSAEYRSASLERASAVEQTSTSTEELARVAQSIAGTAADVAAKAEETFAAASSCQTAAEALLEAMSHIENNNRKVFESTEMLRDSGDQIRRAVQLVAALSERADLLALVADLESTRAGVAGQGFAIVAAEMRRLGQEVVRSTSEINALLEDVSDASVATIAATQAGLATTISTAELGRRFVADVEQILAHAKATSESAAEISKVTGSERESAIGLAVVMGDVLALSHQGEGMTSRLSDQTDALAEVSQDLRCVLETFETDPPPTLRTAPRASAPSPRTPRSPPCPA